MPKWHRQKCKILLLCKKYPNLDNNLNFFHSLGKKRFKEILPDKTSQISPRMEEMPKRELLNRNEEAIKSVKRHIDQIIQWGKFNELTSPVLNILVNCIIFI